MACFNNIYQAIARLQAVSASHLQLEPVCTGPFRPPLERRLQVSAQLRRPELSIQSAVRSNLLAFATAGQDTATPTLVLQEVDFAWKGSGSQVLLTGDFLGWDKRVSLDKGTDGVFHYKQKLLPGTYKYKYVVDGEWVHSPESPTVEDGQGGYNNLITVTDEPPAPTIRPLKESLPTESVSMKSPAEAVPKANKAAKPSTPPTVTEEPPEAAAPPSLSKTVEEPPKAEAPSAPPKTVAEASKEVSPPPPVVEKDLKAEASAAAPKMVDPPKAAEVEPKVAAPPKTVKEAPKAESRPKAVEEDQEAAALPAQPTTVGEGSEAMAPPKTVESSPKAAAPSSPPKTAAEPRKAPAPSEPKAVEGAPKPAPSSPKTTDEASKAVSPPKGEEGAPKAAPSSPKTTDVASKAVSAPKGEEGAPKAASSSPKPKTTDGSSKAVSPPKAEEGAPKAAPSSPKPKTTDGASKAASPPKAAPAARAAKKVEKPYPQIISEDVIPKVKDYLQKHEGISDVEVDFQDNQLEGSFLKNRIVYSFWAFFPDGKLEGSRGFSVSSHGSPPSTVEPFLVDEKRITADLIAFWVLKRLAAQRIIDY